MFYYLNFFSLCVLDLQVLRVVIYTYLLKLGTIQNDQKPAKTSQSQQKRPKTSQNDLPKIVNDLKFKKNWGNLGLSTCFHFSNIKPKCPNLGILGQKVFTLYSYTFQFFWAKMYELSLLNEILHVPYFEGVDFQFDIGFKIFEPKSPNLGILDQKVSTFSS